MNKNDSEKIRVRFNPDGVTAKEVNPLGEKPQRPFTGGLTAWQNNEQRWQQAESKLRTFTTIGTEKFDAGTILEAEIISEGKIKIL